METATDKMLAAVKPEDEGVCMSLSRMIEEERWESAFERASKSPQEAASGVKPSPLALACRFGAPVKCIRAILDAAPTRLRELLDSRGTPLHEAVVCEHMGADVIEALLKADENLGSETQRATLLQDVDGFTPLHLLIRRRFQSHIMNPGEDTASLMQILEMLVSSCPDAVVIPNREEYEEPPIVYALKANTYAPSLSSEDETLARVERQIYEMVDCMLRYCPLAASKVYMGYRGQYTALHSAVFHGRYTSTIDLLLQAEAENPSDRKAALLGNTQGELPLHFCAMRGEQPRSIALIANVAPEAVFQRDLSGLTPFHWVWIRFISTLLTLENGRQRGCDSTFSVDVSRPAPFETNHYNDFSSLEQGNIESDLHLIKRLDPPVDFLRMRHIPQEILGDKGHLHWAEHTVGEVLRRIRKRHGDHKDRSSQGDVEDQKVIWTHREAVVGLFWTKVVSLLEAAKEAGEMRPSGESVLVHTAFASPCCLPGVARIVSSLFPEELRMADDRGRLPLHYAASRSWHRWDWPREDGHNESTAARLLQLESLSILRTALSASSPDAVRVSDGDNRLVLHLAIETFVNACALPARPDLNAPLQSVLEILRELILMYPESLQRRDGATMLYPFLQSTAVATDQKTQAHLPDELPLSITFQLLREDPTILVRDPTQ